MANARRLSAQLADNSNSNALDSTRPPHHTPSMRSCCICHSSSARVLCESHLPDRPLARLSRSAHTPALPAAPTLSAPCTANRSLCVSGDGPSALTTIGRPSLRGGRCDLQLRKNNPGCARSAAAEQESTHRAQEQQTFDFSRTSSPHAGTFTQHHHHSSSPASVMAMAAKRRVPPDWSSPPAPTPNYISRTVSVRPLRASVNVSKRQEEKRSCATGRLYLMVTRRVCQFHAEFDINDDCRIVAIDGSRSLSEPSVCS